jgi:hypothetical protein
MKNNPGDHITTHARGRPRAGVERESAMKEKTMTKTKTKKLPVVLIRSQSAGVHVGELLARDGQSVTMVAAHRVWRWRGANTLHELSQRGGDQSWTRISERVPEITILGVIEIIECSSEAATNLRTPRWP